MIGTYLGEFEELVLLAVAILYGDAYGLAIVDELGKTNRPQHHGELHTQVAGTAGRQRFSEIAPFIL